MATTTIGASLHRLAALAIAVASLPAFAADMTGSCESIPAEALLALLALLFALRPLGKR